MRKLQSARDFLLSSPLGIQAEKLLTFAEQGTVTHHRGGPLSFAVQYTAHLIVTDYTGEPSNLFCVVLDWINQHAPATPPDAVKFHVDILDHRRADISIKVDLTDVVKARTDDTGTTLSDQVDPDALGIDMAALTPGMGT